MRLPIGPHIGAGDDRLAFLGGLDEHGGERLLSREVQVDAFAVRAGVDQHFHARALLVAGHRQCHPAGDGLDGRFAAARVRVRRLGIAVIDVDHRGCLLQRNVGPRHLRPCGPRGKRQPKSQPSAGNPPRKLHISVSRPGKIQPVFRAVLSYRTSTSYHTVRCWGPRRSRVLPARASTGTAARRLPDSSNG